MSNSTSSGVAVPVTQNQAFSGKNGLKEIPYAEGLGSLGRSAIATLIEYIDYMDPKKTQNQAEAVRKQVGLYSAINLTINRNTEDFNKTWDAILRIFNDYKDTALHERSIFRYMAFITLDEEKRTAYRRLINLIKVTAPVPGRSIALRQVDLERTLSVGITEEGRNRVLNFYRQWMVN